MSDHAVRATASAAGATAAVVLPFFLLGSLSVLMSPELRYDVAGLGFAVSAYFTVCALVSVPVGRVVERYGPTIATRAGVLIAAASLVGIAVIAHSYATLVWFLVLGGASNGLAQLGSNASLARHVPPHRQGLAFGAKQAAVPAATLLAGAAVPALGLTVGWRPAFALAGVLVLLVIPLVPPDTRGRGPDAAEPRHRGPDAAGNPADRIDPVHRVTAPLLVVAVAAALAAGTAGALGSFLVDSSVSRGLDPGLAGLTLSLGGAVGVGARLLGGWLADRRTGGHIAVVAGMLVTGAFGLALLALPTGPALVVGTVLAFGLGWSWPGLLNFAVVRLHPSAPAAATSVTQAGVYAGSGIGPLAFGALVKSTSYPTAWLVAAAAMVAAGALMALGRRMLVRRREERVAAGHCVPSLSN